MLTRMGFSLALAWLYISNGTALKGRQKNVLPELRDGLRYLAPHFHELLALQPQQLKIALKGREIDSRLILLLTPSI
jgi:hypothetical protein